MKKWYLSKTILVAMAMEALAQVTLHMEEVKTAIASHTNTDAGLAFAIAFPAVMVMMRFITTKPIEGVKKNVQNNRSDENMGDSWADDIYSNDGVMGLIPKPSSDSNTGERESNTQRDDQNQRGATSRPINRGRTKRRGCKKG
jgi:hypothetical protein